jgi:hypothetical protein
VASSISSHEGVDLIGLLALQAEGIKMIGGNTDYDGDDDS